MSKLTPIEQAELLEKEYRSYVKSTFTLDDELYNSKFKTEIDNVELLKGPFLNKMLPFKTQFDINELISNGILHKDFLQLGDIVFDRKLYEHQVESINKVNNGRSIVVTTGTGSGKTESYLFPIINSILNDPEIEKPGVRAIFLFPMNALVNDQMKRIRDILSTYPKIKFGRYVGDTKDGVDPKSERKRLSKVYNKQIPSNELVTREEIRENPPHLLFTNYSMLEYLLLRPKDKDLLDSKNTSKWQFIVLDEAHTYNGALGIEVGMLLRRLTEKIQRKPQFILTSATLGDKGKSEKEIVKFACNLTGSEFQESDIIFSSRKNVVSVGKYRCNTNDYSLIKDNLTDENYVKSILAKYKYVSSDSLDEALYNVLIEDENVLYLNEIFASHDYFSNIYNSFNAYGFTKKNLSDFIYLISYVYTKTRKLFDIKYHTFVRTIDGCFVTLNNDKNLSLKRTLEINDYKAFEIGKCKKCDTVYIIGKEEGGFLRQNTDLDIYENVEEGITAPVEYYLINDDVSTYDQEYLEEFKLCVKCGKIYAADETHPDECGCGEDNIKKIYRVKKDSSSDKTNSSILYNNNITYCPCCRKSANSGIVSSFYLGKDATTAILTQIMLKAIDNGVETIKVESDNPFEAHEETINSDYVKQMLEFSDGRQQASFAATFCEYNHERFLRKKLLFDVCKDSSTPIDFSTVKSKLENKIMQYNLFDNKYANEDGGDNKNAWITILNELLNIDGVNGAEGLGLYAFKMDVSKIEKNASFIKPFFAKYGITDYNLQLDEFLCIVNAIINIFRTVPAIQYNDSNLSYEEKRDEFSYRMFDNDVELQKTVGEVLADSKGKDISKRVRSLLPVNSTTNKLLEYVMVSLGKDVTYSKKFIEITFMLMNNIGLIEQGTIPGVTYKIPASSFMLYGPKTLKWYKCSKCKTITINNFNCVCPTCASKSLIDCDPNIELESNYYRKEYISKKEERLVFREHTGQLKSEEATKIQQQFQEKKINVLSCSTTFEMGVDIGTLETVFMRNVPPTPANYVQRAGRAGRGKDSSAFVLTFCGNSSHDYTYFKEPENMISGKITPPLFKINNKKIVLRHIIDSSLSFYLRLNEKDFECIGNFIKDYHMYEGYINSRPLELNEFINHFISDTKLTEYYNYGWIDAVIGPNGVLKNYYDEYVSDIKELEDLVQQYKNSDDFDNAQYYQRQIEKKNETKFIDALANANIIPKYGFPVDNVNLRVPSENANVDLNRDLQIALSEYAPDSEVIAEGVKYTSRYVVLPKKGGLTKNYYMTCDSCGRVTYNIDKSKVAKCSICGMESENKDKYFIVPSQGFKSDIKKSTSRTVKPKKSYSNEIQYLGNGINEINIDYNGKVTLISNRDDELLVLNESAFYMCNLCGYTIIDKESQYKGIVQVEKEHSTGYDTCNCKTLYPMSLGYTFRTDVVKLQFEKHYSLEHSLSFLYAFLDGISIAFSIERNDINGVIAREADSTYSIIVYDDVPGGAGHVKRLLNSSDFENVLKTTLNKVSTCTCDVNTACYNCLRNYRNQRKHKFLSRTSAIIVLNDVLTPKKVK